jgi:hypothetical protein
MDHIDVDVWVAYGDGSWERKTFVHWELNTHGREDVGEIQRIADAAQDDPANERVIATKKVMIKFVEVLKLITDLSNLELEKDQISQMVRRWTDTVHSEFSNSFSHVPRPPVDLSVGAHTVMVSVYKIKECQMQSKRRIVSTGMAAYTEFVHKTRCIPSRFAAWLMTLAGTQSAEKPLNATTVSAVVLNEAMMKLVETIQQLSCSYYASKPAVVLRLMDAWLYEGYALSAKHYFDAAEEQEAVYHQNPLTTPAELFHTDPLLF